MSNPEKQKCKKMSVVQDESTVQCEICNKVFYDTGQKLKPKYALTHHKKTCREISPKKMKVDIRTYLNSIDDFEFLKRMEFEFREQSGMEWIKNKAENNEPITIDISQLFKDKHLNSQ